MIENCLKIPDGVIPCPESYNLPIDYIDKSNLKIRKNSEILQKLDRESNIAFVVLDMQGPLVRKKVIGKTKRKRIINYQRFMLNECKKRDIPVIVMEYYGMGDTINSIAKMVDNISTNFFMLREKDDSGFSVPNFYETLLNLNVRKIYLMGVNTMYCVRATAEDAIDHGIDVAVSEFGIAQPSKWKYERNLEDGSIFFGSKGTYYTERSVEKIIKENRDVIIRKIKADSK